MEARSSRKRRSVIDQRYTRVSASKPPSARRSSSRTGSFARLRCSPGQCSIGASFFPLPFTLTHANSRQSHRYSTLDHRLCCRERSPCRQERAGYCLSGMRHRVRALSFISRNLSPLHQGLFFWTWLPPTAHPPRLHSGASWAWPSYFQVRRFKIHDQLGHM